MNPAISILLSTAHKTIAHLFFFFFSTEYKGNKVKYLMKEFKRNDFVLLNGKFLFTDKLELIQLSDSHGIPLFQINTQQY